MDAARLELDATARWNRLERRVGLDPSEALVVALSGGADSVLLLALAALAKPRRRIYAVHVEHELRGLESRADADFCARLCLDLGVPLARPAAPVDPDAPDLESRARRARYAALAAEARRVGARAVATGHHADDALETLLMRWLRGTELAGLAGLKARAPLPGDDELVVVRPLIDWRREEVRELLRAAGLPWREDSSNVDPRFTRNRVRHALMPLLSEHCGPEGVANLRAFANSVESFEARLARSTAVLRWDPPTFAAARRGRTDAHVGGSLARGELARLAPALRRRALWRLLTEGTGTAPPPRALDSALDDLASGRCRRHGLAGGWRLQLRSDRLHLTPPAAELDHPRVADATEQLRFPFGEGTLEALSLTVPGVVDLDDGRAISAALCSPPPSSEVPRRRTVVELDAAQLDGPLTVRFARAGDRFHALGAPGPRRLGRFLRDVGVPREERGRIPLVFSGTELVWVAGVRPAESVRVGPRTRERLRLELSGAAEEVGRAEAAVGAGGLFQDRPAR